MPSISVLRGVAAAIALTCGLTGIGLTGTASASPAAATISITNPGARYSYLGDPVRLPVQATESPSGGALSYAAAPLPNGLSISASTGVISGVISPLPVAGSGTDVTITVTDAGTGASATTEFTWTIEPYFVPFSQYAGPMPSRYPGKCLTARSTKHGLAAELERRDGSTRQVVSWVDQLELKVGGKCLTVRGFDGSSRPADDVRLQTCVRGSERQFWQVTPAGIVIDAQYAACLDAPAARAGQPVKLVGCSPFDTTPARGMRWVVPAAPVKSVAGGCLDETLSRTGKPDGKVRVRTCTGAAEQVWGLYPVSTPHTGARYEVQAEGGCLAVRSAATVPGTTVKLRLTSSGCGAGATWQPRADGELVDTHSGLCLTGSAGSHGGLPEISGCAGRADQRWTLPANPVVAEVPGLCLTTTATASAVRAAVVAARCNGSYGQQWTWGSDGTLRAQSRCLTIAGPASAGQSAVRLSDCRAGDKAQKWQPATDFTLINPVSGECLSLPGDDPAAGSPVTAGACGATPDDQWRLE